VQASIEAFSMLAYVWPRTRDAETGAAYAHLGLGFRSISGALTVIRDGAGKALGLDFQTERLVFQHLILIENDGRVISGLLRI
jgi:hypothetical protein